MPPRSPFHHNLAVTRVCDESKGALSERQSGWRGGSVLERPPTSPQQICTATDALSWPCSGRLARPTIPRPDSLSEVEHAAACKGNERASRRREAWRKCTPRRLGAASTRSTISLARDVTETACTRHPSSPILAPASSAAISSASSRAGRQRMQSRCRVARINETAESPSTSLCVLGRLLRQYFLPALSLVFNRSPSGSPR